MELIKQEDCIYLDCLTMNKDDLSALNAYISYFLLLNKMEFLIIMKSKIADMKLIKFNVEYKEKIITPIELESIITTLYEQNKIDKMDVCVETSEGIRNILLKFPLIDLGIPDINARKIPIMTDKSVFINQTIEILGKKYKVSCLSLNNPYMVVFVDDLDQLLLDEIGFYFENYRQFPQGVNVVFTEVIDENKIRIRTWKRKIGEVSFDQEACALSTVASVLNKLFNRNQEIKVEENGLVNTFIFKQDDHIIMKTKTNNLSHVKKKTLV